jgi:ribosomal protein S21|tara:strand:+ start:386 stop:751 length:366 start_codon:yes stop_codon:yes gene_type:complete
MTDKPRKKYDLKTFSNNNSNFGKFEQKRDRRPRREPDPPGLAVAVTGDDVMKAYRRLKKKMMKDNLMDTIRDKRYYKKPSEVRQEKLKEQRRNMQKSQREKAREYGIRYKNYDPNASKQRG